MDILKKKEFWLHLLLTALLALLFGLWLHQTWQQSPQRMHPEGAPPRETLERQAHPPRHGTDPGRGRGPLRPETLIIVFGIVLTVAANITSGAYFRAQKNKQRLIELEKENLQRQLETLRYQINPHFFMNTLNNIHALVDIDPRKAKESIEEFSKMMRFVLYDDNSPTIPLYKEFECIKHYISLMRLRFTEDVEIDLSLPEDTGTTMGPPLIMTSFIENAFKHGISYEQKSFIRVRASIDGGMLSFCCINSKTKQRTDTQHGLGMDNTRKRLELLYGDAYSLVVHETPNSYEIKLTFPV